MSEASRDAGTTDTPQDRHTAPSKLEDQGEQSLVASCRVVAQSGLQRTAATAALYVTKKNTGGKSRKEAHPLLDEDGKLSSAGDFIQENT